MESIGLARSMVPPAHVLYGPAAAIGTMALLPKHPNLRKLREQAQAVIKSLRQVSAQPIGLAITVTPTPDPSLHEEACASLEALRNSADVLNGIRARILERDLARFVPGLAPKFIAAREEALSRMNELRAALAFFLGEPDDTELGYEFVPPPPPFGSPAPSLALDPE